MEPAGQPLRVLLVEDNPVNQQVLLLLLRKQGFQVSVAVNGLEAVEAHEREPFDLILMDLQMPVMDGLRATKLIRAREKTTGTHVPIVAVTASAMHGERQRCLSAGMDDYLSKPVRSADLLPAVNRLVRPEPPRAESAPRPAPAEVWLGALEAMGFDASARRRLVDTFVQTVPPRLDVLREACQEVVAGGTSPPAPDGEPGSPDARWRQVQQLAHTLKGSLAVFGVKTAVEAAARLEQVAREQRTDECGPAASELLEEVGALLASMKGHQDSRV